MDICLTCIIFLGCGVYLLVQMIRFIFADADFTLLWAARFGSKPGVYTLPTTETHQVLPWSIYTESLGPVFCALSCSSTKPVDHRSREESVTAYIAPYIPFLPPHPQTKNRKHTVSWESSPCPPHTHSVHSITIKKDILVLPLDLLDRASHPAKARAVLQHFSNVDVLINNGGRSQRSLCVDTDMEVYQGLMDLNYLGTVSVTKQVLPHMTRHGSGIIATVSSISGLAAAPLSTGYCASKHALQGFFNTLRSELTDYPDISVIMICPGPVVSQIVQNAFTEQPDKPVSSAGDQMHKMTTERCVCLILAGLSNRVKEMWIAQQPFLLMFYLWQYAPTLAWYMTNMLGKKRVQNFKAGLDADSAYFTKAKVKTT
ncbi:dehydrogenase/reductase SDR family member 7 [Electrophorus electricus]|uniref:dehydrogenase/reductase SDR family member 7 n=1 Tax=Electrophorus electricus TaxID=8005 RepID=UPI0015D0C837|nr:dehydrogenase/reductase SDR family member 7 [Electrophorus electricus]